MALGGWEAEQGTRPHALEAITEALVPIRCGGRIVVAALPTEGHDNTVYEKRAGRRGARKEVKGRHTPPMMARMRPSNEATDKQAYKTQHSTGQRAKYRKRVSLSVSRYNAPTRTDVPQSDIMAA